MFSRYNIYKLQQMLAMQGQGDTNDNTPRTDRHKCWQYKDIETQMLTIQGQRDTYDNNPRAERHKCWQSKDRETQMLAI